MLLVQSKKQIITQKLLKLKKILTDHNHDKLITTPDFKAGVFTAKLAEANLIRKASFDKKNEKSQSKN